jgi:hypothetical protein
MVVARPRSFGDAETAFNRGDAFEGVANLWICKRPGAGFAMKYQRTLGGGG